MPKIALIAGALGINGSNLISTLLSKEHEADWEQIITLSRRSPQDAKLPWAGHPKIRHINVDLSNDADSKTKIQTEVVARVTHVYFMAYVPDASEERARDRNMQLLRNVLDNADAVAKNLEHVFLLTGTKYYGPHRGPYKTPSREDDPRHEGVNFYYDQEDYVAGKQKGKKWTWSVSRPFDIIGYANNNAMNIGTTLALYATICKALRLPFVFPGTRKSWTMLNDSTSVKLLADQIIWMSTSRNPAVTNDAYNCVNGDVYRWQYLWPKIAAYFGMEPVGPGETKLDLEGLMKDKEAAWDELVKKHGLQQWKLQDLATWGFLSWRVSTEYDCVTDMNKSREAGFLGFVDTEKAYLRLFDELQECKIIPPIKSL